MLEYLSKEGDPNRKSKSQSEEEVFEIGESSVSKDEMNQLVLISQMFTHFS